MWGLTSVPTPIYSGRMWGEFWATLGAVGLGLLFACTLLNVLAAVILARRSMPRVLQARWEAIEVKVFESVSKMAEMEAQIATWRAELEGLIEEAGNQFDRVERKRASAAAAVSAANRLNGGGGDGGLQPGMTREQRLTAIRRHAHGGGGSA